VREGGGDAFEDRVLRVLRALRPGEVVTYGEVAAEAGSPGAARAVGNILAGCDDDVPWWRVVTTTGRLVPDVSSLLHQASRDGEIRLTYRELTALIADAVRSLRD